MLVIKYVKHRSILCHFNVLMYDIACNRCISRLFAISYTDDQFCIFPVARVCDDDLRPMKRKGRRTLLLEEEVVMVVEVAHGFAFA